MIHNFKLNDIVKINYLNFNNEQRYNKPWKIINKDNSYQNADIFIIQSLLNFCTHINNFYHSVPT